MVYEDSLRLLDHGTLSLQSIWWVCYLFNRVRRPCRSFLNLNFCYFQRSTLKGLIILGKKNKPKNFPLFPTPYFCFYFSEMTGSTNFQSKKAKFIHYWQFIAPKQGKVGTYKTVYHINYVSKFITSRGFISNHKVIGFIIFFLYCNNAVYCSH